MFWKAIALFGAGSFFFVGWGVLTDPLCNSVSFRGGGARTVLTTCYPDSSGDFSKVSAVTGSWLIGLAILGILFWPTIRVLINNYQYNQKLVQATKEYSSQEDEVEGVKQPLDQPSNLVDNQIFNLKNKLIENKLITIVLVVVLVFGFYKVVAPKISLLNPITCSGLKKELAKKDVIGRQLWNEYQAEVSKLSEFQQFPNQYYLQVGNVARRMLQLSINDLQGYEMVQEKPHCAEDLEVLKAVIDIVNIRINYLKGVGLMEGKKFDVYNGWNTDFYNSYSDFTTVLM